MFTYIAAPWYGQKIFAAASEKTAFIAVGISSVIVFLLYSFPILALTFLRINGVIGINPEEGIPYIIKMYFPAGLKAVAFAVLFAAAATTLSGIWSALTTMLVGDYLLSAKNPKLGKDYIGSMKIYFAFAVISWLLGNIFVDKILNKLILANIPIAALSFSLLAGFYWDKASRRGAIISISLGLIWGIGCYLYLGDDGGYTWFWAAYGIPLIFVSGVIGSFLFPQSVEEKKILENFKLRMKEKVDL
jgi:Na+/proline symporter